MTVFLGKLMLLPPGPHLLEIHAIEPVSETACRHIEAELRAELDAADRSDIRVIICQPGFWLRIWKHGWLASLLRS